MSTSNRTNDRGGDDNEDGDQNWGRKWRRNKRDPKSLKHAKICILIFCGIIALLFTLPELWIVATSKPTVRIARTLLDTIPVPNLNISFPFNFNVTCKFTYLSGNDGEECQPYIRQPSGAEGTPQTYSAQLISIDMTDLSKPHLNFSRNNGRYGVALTIYLNDGNYKASQDFGMFVTAVDPEFDPATLPEKPRKVINKLDPDFFGYLEHANEQVVGPNSNNYMLTSRHLAKRINPEWIGYIGIPSHPFSYYYITTTYDAASSSILSAKPLTGRTSGIYANLYVSTFDWVLTTEDEYRTNDLLEALALIAAFSILVAGFWWALFGPPSICIVGCCQICCFRKTTRRNMKDDYKTSPFIKRTRKNDRTNFMERMDDFEAFIRRYIVKTDYLGGYRSVDEENPGTPPRRQSTNQSYFQQVPTETQHVDRTFANVDRSSAPEYNNGYSSSSILTGPGLSERRPQKSQPFPTDNLSSSIATETGVLQTKGPGTALTALSTFGDKFPSTNATESQDYADSGLNSRLKSEGLSMSEKAPTKTIPGVRDSLIENATLSIKLLDQESEAASKSGQVETKIAQVADNNGSSATTTISTKPIVLPAPTTTISTKPIVLPAPTTTVPTKTVAVSTPTIVKSHERHESTPTAISTSTSLLAADDSNIRRDNAIKTTTSSLGRSPVIEEKIIHEEVPVIDEKAVHVEGEIPVIEEDVQEIIYVDEKGNRLDLDEHGNPIFPSGT